MRGELEGGGSWGDPGFPHVEETGVYQSGDYFTIDRELTR
jgi:hypothetical protein